jgi:hypothetical protein
MLQLGASGGIVASALDDPAVRAPLHAPRPESVSEALRAFRALPL